MEIWQKKTQLPLTERMTKLEIYEEQSIRFNSIIRQINQKITKTGTSEILQKRENTPSSTVNLPKMELKTFDGNVLKWHEFWENFEHCVHNQPLVQELQKFIPQELLEGPSFRFYLKFRTEGRKLWTSRSALEGEVWSQKCFEESSFG